MEKLTILSADLLDIIFEHRNKSYGAYELRKTYNKRIKYALAGTLGICLLFIGGTILANSGNENQKVEFATDIELTKFHEEPPKPEIPPVPPPKVEPPQVAVSQFTPPKIVVDDEVKPEDEIKEMDMMADTKIGTTDIEGRKDDGIEAPLVEKTTVVAGPLKVEEDYDVPFAVVHIEARFAGGMEAWQKYLRKYLNSDLPAQNGAPANKYTVVVSFIVDKTGAISDVRAENDPGYGTKAEAIRVIQKSPNWTPAVQNGRNVIYRQKQAITFQVMEE